ncbi:flagellar protein FlhE [Halomonas binhaiensis]|uniref:Flagellar protein FlhE n=1 Tax=Halomonas binhaiensis TaxID=2562282 RepID=A0A5C1NKA9_9GAMM|nr:flagellar protein FlhE [Halomonas binhaiensis]QEM83784.1 flagellar protein FlhE [Halomonas binhaiensis]
MANIQISMASCRALRLWSIKIGQVVLLNICLIVFASSATATPGAWSATAPRLNVASSEIPRRSALLRPPSGPIKGAITRVSWHYRAPPGSRLSAYLCANQHCQYLAAEGGASDAFHGLPASAPLQFRFRLHPDQRPVTIEALDVLVNHR